MNLEQGAAILSLVVSVSAVAAVFVALGRRDQRLTDLERRHGDLAKETRDRLGGVEHRAQSLERWQAAVDTKLDQIREALVELKTIVSTTRKGR